MFARVRPLSSVDPAVVIFRSFVRERAAAYVASILLQTLVNVSDVPRQILLDPIGFPAQVTFARSFVGMNANMAQEASFCEYHFLAGVAFVRDAVVYHLLRLIHQLGLVWIFDSVHVEMSVYMLLQFRLLRELFPAQVTDEVAYGLLSILRDRRFHIFRPSFFRTGRQPNFICNGTRLLNVVVVHQHVLLEVFLSALVHQLAILTVMHLGLVHRVHVLKEILHVHEDDVALSALDVLYLLGVRGFVNRW